MDIEHVVWKDEILALIVRRDYARPGVHFFTPDDFSQQLGFMRHPAGKRIQPHVHQPVDRALKYTQEVLFIRKGKLRVDFYSREQDYIESRVLEAGDVILLASAGHGFQVLEDLEMFEVKQGPYSEHEDKVRFDGIAGSQLVQGDSGK
jgi:mannose-6-phosphate isomerase-like protein (cupin superfamily)